MSVTRPYQRLTSAPSPSFVRPLPVLSSSLEHIAALSSSGASYDRVLSELRSVRQDITLQGLAMTSLSFDVYYFNMVASLENGDVEEVGVCVEKLWSFVDAGSCAERKADVITSVKILKCLLPPVTPLSPSLQFLAPHLSSLGPISTVSLRIATWHNLSSSWMMFFSEYERCSNATCYVLDYLVSKFRRDAYDNINASYREINVAVVEGWLGKLMEGQPLTEGEVKVLVDKGCCLFFRAFDVGSNCYGFRTEFPEQNSTRKKDKTQGQG